ncbi:MAG: ribosome biogenesis factor YjgA [Pseudomonadales bacterium]|jgi:ribosome-associated protein
MALDELSKSERKRDATRLQNLGRALTELNTTQLAEVPLSDPLAKAVDDYHRISSNEARRRQLQFIGKLMRAIDTAALQSALELIQGRSPQARFEFRQLEAWRDRLIGEPAALTEYLSEHQDTDRQELRHHIQRAHKARDPDQQRAAGRALFRFLRSSRQVSDQPD